MPSITSKSVSYCGVIYIRHTYFDSLYSEIPDYQNVVITVTWSVFHMLASLTQFPKYTNKALSTSQSFHSFSSADLSSSITCLCSFYCCSVFDKYNMVIYTSDYKLTYYETEKVQNLPNFIFYENYEQVLASPGLCVGICHHLLCGVTTHKLLTHDT